jgi:4'-phosphopantetheinyl transferase
MNITSRSNVSELNIPARGLFEWKLPPKKLDLEDDQIHIWKVGLNAGNPHADYQKILSIDEQLRAAKLISSEKRLRFQSARSALRNILSLYVNQPSENIQFKYGPNGKPYLLLDGQPGLIEFNIAHSENLMLAVFAQRCPVGIDLEFRQPVSTRDWIVNQYFSKIDRGIFQNLSEEEKETAFLNIWIKKEAYGKAMGTGLSHQPQLNLLKPGAPTSISTGHYVMELDNSIRFLYFAPEEAFTAAVAVISTKTIKPFFWASQAIAQTNQPDSFFKV